MTDYRQICRYIFVVVAILLVIGLEVKTARLGGGGLGSRGGRYRGGYRSSYRGSSSRWSGISPWKTALIAGTVYYGSHRYMTRRRYYNNQAPQICENTHRTEDGMVYGKFVCPLGEQPDDYDYCCGEAGNQRCCRFTDDGGRVAGLVIGILFFFLITGLVIFCCCKHHQKFHKKSEALFKRHNSTDRASAAPNTQIPLQASEFDMKPTSPQYTTYPNGTEGYPQMGGYSQAGAPGYPGYPQDGAPGYPAADGFPQPGGYPQGEVSDYPAPYPSAEPPSYDESSGLPYSPNPTVDYPAPGAPEGQYPPQYPPQYPGSVSPPQYPRDGSGGPTMPMPSSQAPGDQRGEPPYPSNPVGFVDPSAPNYSYSGSSTGQGYSNRPA